MPSFAREKRPKADTILNMKATPLEVAAVDCLVVLLGVQGGRSGVLRAGLDALVGSLPAAERERLERMAAEAVASA